MRDVAHVSMVRVRAYLTELEKRGVVVLDHERRWVSKGDGWNLWLAKAPRTRPRQSQVPGADGFDVGLREALTRVCEQTGPLPVARAFKMIGKLTVARLERNGLVMRCVHPTSGEFIYPTVRGAEVAGVAGVAS